MKELQYMVDFSLPETLTKDFMDEIPYQRAMVNRLFREGVLLNYALSLEKSKMWAIIKADSVTSIPQKFSGKNEKRLCWSETFQSQ